MAAVYLVSLRTLFRLAPSPNILLFLVSRQETRRGVPFYFTFPPQIRPEDNFNLLRISCQLNCAPYDWAGLRGAAQYLRWLPSKLVLLTGGCSRGGCPAFPGL